MWKDLLTVAILRREVGSRWRSRWSTTLAGSRSPHISTQSAPAPLPVPAILIITSSNAKISSKVSLCCSQRSEQIFCKVKPFSHKDRLRKCSGQPHRTHSGAQAPSPTSILLPVPQIVSNYPLQPAGPPQYYSLPCKLFWPGAGGCRAAVSLSSLQTIDSSETFLS